VVERNNGYIATDGEPLAAEVPFRKDYVYVGQRPFLTVTVDQPSTLSQNLPQGRGVETVDPAAPAANTRNNGYIAEGATVGWETWFESFHVIPREFHFGNLLSTQLVPIEVYSAYRRDNHTWTAWVNNAGIGTSILGIPTFPHTFVPQSNGGLSMTLQVTTNGPPVVDTDLEFIFDTQTILTPITLKRVVLFGVRPELPFTERLRWFTEVLGHINGTEQRISARKNPRQVFEWDFILEDGAERSYFHNVLFQWQPRIFGLPVWFERTRATAAIAANATTVNVQHTNFADYRVGGLVLVFKDRSTFDVLELASLTSTSLTFVTGVLNSYPTGTAVMPLRTGTTKRALDGSRFVVGAARLKIMFEVLDNDISIASTAAFPSFNSKVHINGCNSVRGEMSEQFETDIVVFDNEVGIPIQSTPWDVGKRLSQLALLTKGRQALWEARQLLHALRGKQVSFYVSSFTHDFTIDSAILAGTLINVANVGYTQFVQNRQPRNVIRITYNDGSPDDIRTIVSSSVVDATREALTLNSAIGAHAQSAVKKIMYVEKVRWDSDEILIRHEAGDRVQRITGPIKTVFE
jgi:hypothetical protein